MRSTFKVLFYLKKNKHKIQSVVPVMGRITVNGTIAQFSAKLSVPPHLWEVKGGRAKGKSLEADRPSPPTDGEVKGGVSKPTVSTAIWIIFVSRSESITSLSATVTDMFPPIR